MLDIRTLSLTTVLHCGLFAIGLGLYAFTADRHRVILRFAAANLSLSIGFLLLGLRDIAGDFVTVVLANTLLAVGFLGYQYGSFGFRKLKPGLMSIGIGGLAVHTVVFVVFTYFRPDVNVRIIAINAFIVMESGLCAYAFLRTARPKQLVQDLVAAFAFVELALYCVFRTVWTLSGPTLSSFMDAGAVHAVTFIMVQLLVIQASLAIIWIATSELSRDFELQARLDPLTKVLNRRAFAEESGRELARSRRSGAPFSVILIDLDQLKEVNDTYGHEAGDLALVSLAGEMGSILRTEDTLARLGGDEFAILLPHAPRTEAAAVARRIRSQIESRQFGFGNRLICITVSLGVAAWRDDGNGVDELLRQADAALYRAKAGGRNRVEIA